MIRENVGLLFGIFYLDIEEVEPLGPVIQGALPEMKALPSYFDKVDLLLSNTPS